MSRLWLTVSYFVLVMLFTGSLLAQDAQRMPVMKDGLRDQVRQGDLKMDVGGPVPASATAADVLVNNNTGATGTSFFTQSESDVLAWGNFVLIVFNDAGSNAGGANKFTGWSRSTDGGATFVDGGMLPVSTVSDAGDPVLARNETTGRIYFSTLGFNSPGNIQMFRSDDNGATWMAPVNATPGGGNEDKQWHTVDNFAGTGNGNVYLLTRNFGSGSGIFFYRSTNNGDTFGPSGGTLIVSGNQGAYIAVGPDHSVYAFWYAGGSLQVRKSTDFGVTFGAAVTVVSGLIGGTNGDLGLTGIRQGTTTPSGFRSNEFPHVAINPASGNIYVTYNNDGAGSDKCDIFLVQSTDGGAAWSAPVKINDDVTTTDQWQPTVAVTPAGNKIGIFYYSRQEDPTGNNLFKFYGRVGDISGAAISFPAPSFAISDVASLPEFGRDATVNSVYMGDYQHAYATPTAFHVAWSDNRDDLAGGAPRKDPNMYYEQILTTDNFGWARGTITNVSGGAALSGVNVDFVQTPNAPSISNGAGFYKAGVQVDTPAVTRDVTLRASKFGFRDTLISLTVTRNDTVTRDFAMTPAAGGTLSVYSHTATTNLRSFVEVKLGTLVVIADSTNGTTGLLTAPLPSGTYSVRVDAPAPNLTLNFPSVVITTGTTNVNALTQSVVTFNPTEMRDTLAVGGSHSKTLAMTNTSPDPVPFRITDDNASARARIAPDPNLPSVQRSLKQQKVINRQKGVENPNPGERNSPNGFGGPDAFGYSWIDSDEPGGPIFSWTDIRPTGTAVTLTDDSNVLLGTLGFNFNFYGTNFNSLRVCSNGWLSFTSTSTSFSNSAIPSTAEPNNALYGFWDDLNPGVAGTVHYLKDSLNGRFTVQYTGVIRFGTTTDSVTFQIILKSSGEILYQYLRMAGVTNSATVGIENATGTVALQVVSDAPYVHDNLAVRFFLPDAPWLSENPLQGTIPASGVQNIICSFDATNLTPGTTYNANIFVEATHPDLAGRFTVPASLRVNPAAGAVINVVPTTLTFPSTVIGSSRRDSSRVRNVGTATLTISSVTSTNTRFVPTATSTIIAPGDSARIRVTYAPVVPAGTDTGRVIILSSDPGNPRVDIILTGTAVGAPLLADRIDSLVRPAMQSGTRDSMQFYVRNVGTASGNFAARAIMYPRTGPQGSPVTIPLEISPARRQPIVYDQTGLPPTSFGPAPVSGYRPASGEASSLSLLVDGRGYSVQSSAPQFFAAWTLTSPNPVTNLGGTFPTFIGAATIDLNNQASALAVEGTNLIRIDTANGSKTTIGPITPFGGETFTGMAFDPTTGTLYASSTNITRSTLYTVNTTTGAATVVGQITNSAGNISLAVNNTGQMFAHDIVADVFMGIDKATGAGTVIGPLGFNANFGQGLEFDPISGICYMAAFNASPQQAEWRTVDITTGATTFLGTLGTAGQQFGWLGIAGSSSGSANWLAVVPTSGPIALNDSVLFTARFDATSPVIYNNPGNYFGSIEINTVGAPVPDTLKLPVRMYVVPSAGADLVVIPDTVDIDSVQIGFTDSSKSVLVKNIGQSTLNVTNVTFTGSSGFSANLTSFSLASLDSVRIKVRFTAAAPPGVRAARMNFTSNDPTPGSVGVRAVSFGVPLLADRIDSLVRPAMQSGTRDSIQFYVRNIGTAPGNLAARAIMYPRTGPTGASTGEPVVIPLQLTPVVQDYPRGSAPLSLGRAPRREASMKSNNGAPPLVNLSTLVDERAFGYEYFTGQFVKFNLATPGTVVPLGAFTTADNIFAGGFNNDFTEFFAIKSATNQLIRVDTSNGSYTVIGTVTPAGGESWTAMKFDPTDGTLFATSTNITQSTLYTIDPTTGATTVVGQMTPIPSAIGMAISNTGQMYAYGLDDNFYGVNKGTGAATLIGPIGFDANFAQDMDFDRFTNTLYMAAYNNGVSLAELRTVDLATGATTLIGQIGAVQMELDPFSIKGGGGPSANWLAVVPTSGPIALSDSVLFTARFDASSPVIFSNPGNYFGRIEINTVGSPIPDTLRQPVRMFVVPSPGADLVVIPDTVNIGNVEIGVTDSSKSVLVKNIGQSTLNVTNVTFTGASGFSASRTSFSLVSLDTVRINVRFAAVAPGGVRTARMNFTSNDPTPGSAGLRAVSVGVSHIAVVPDTFHYILPASNDTTRSTFRIRNTGTDTLRYRINEGFTSLTASVLRSQTQQQATSLAKGVENPNPGQSAPDGAGGPDAFGYRWIDSDEPGGPQFAWVDISTIGTQVTFPSSDDDFVTISLPFTFPFYGVDQSSINIVTNGFMNFGPTSSSFSNTAIPTTAAPNDAIYPFWDDLLFSVAGTVHYYHDVANGRFIVQYTDVPHFGSGGPYTFQTILKPNGDMLFQYLTMSSPVDNATIGIENSGGTVALQVVFNAAYMHDNLAILVTKDLLPWMSTSLTDGTIAPGDSQSVELRIHPAGLAGGEYSGRVIVSGNTPDIAVVRVGLSITPVHVADLGTGIPTTFGLSQNYPNPFNPSTTIKYDLPEEATVTLKIYNLLGQEVLTLVNAPQQAGYYESVWNGRNNAGASISSGIYFYRFEAVGHSGQTFSNLKKMVFLK